MRFLPFLACLLLAAFPGATAAAATRAETGDRLTLADGREIRLTGIAAPFAATEEWAEKSRQTLQDLVAERTVALESEAEDRYGRIAAQTYAADGGGKKTWLQGEMLKRGLAFVYPPTGAEARLEEMRALETAARRAGTGIWSDPAYADTPAYAIDGKKGRFAFVSGTVLDAARVKNMVYLNFGPDWRTDFTISIAARHLRAFRKAGIDPLALKGKTVRVRGWIKRNGGPMIAVSDPAQIRISD